MFLVILLYALFASVFTTAKTALDYSQPFFLVGSRMFIAGLLLLAYQYIFKRQELKIRKTDFGRFILLAVFAIYLTNVFEFWGLKYLTSFKTCFIYSLSPFLSALLSYLLLKEGMTSKKWLGLLVGFSGFLPIMLAQSATESATGELWIFSWAELSVVLAAICSVYGWILLKQVVSDGGYSPMTANGYAMLIGGSVALLHSYFVEDWNPLPISDYSIFATCAVILIIVSNLICYNLYGYLLKRHSATFMSFAGFTTPLFTAFFGWLFLGEIVTWEFYLSFAIVFSGLLIFYQEELARARDIPAEINDFSLPSA